MQINLVLPPNRSRLDLAELEATSGVSKVMESFLIWLPWRRALEMDSQWELLLRHRVRLHRAIRNAHALFADLLRRL